MESYIHYSGFLEPAQVFENKRGIPYGNGWIIDNSQYTPWYLNEELKNLGKLEALQTEMTSFVSIATAMEKEGGI